MKIEFVEARSPVVGTVLHEMDKRLAVDAKASLPDVGHEIQLPHPYRKTRVVTAVRWRYGKKGILKIQVFVKERGRRR